MVLERIVDQFKDSDAVVSNPRTAISSTFSDDNSFIICVWLFYPKGTAKETKLSDDDKGRL